MENAANDKRLKIIKSQIDSYTDEIKEIHYLLNSSYRLFEFYVFNEKTGEGQRVQIDNDIMQDITEHALIEHVKRLQEKKLKAWEKLIGE
jgi:hypothetical protein